MNDNYLNYDMLSVCENTAECISDSFGNCISELDMAAAFLAKGDFSSAFTWYSKMIKFGAKSSEAYLGALLALLGARDIDEAVNCLDNITDGKCECELIYGALLYAKKSESARIANLGVEMLPIMARRSIDNFIFLAVTLAPIELDYIRLFKNIHAVLIDGMTAENVTSLGRAYGAFEEAVENSSRRYGEEMKQLETDYAIRLYEIGKHQEAYINLKILCNEYKQIADIAKFYHYMLICELEMSSGDKNGCDIALAYVDDAVRYGLKYCDEADAGIVKFNSFVCEAIESKLDGEAKLTEAWRDALARRLYESDSYDGFIVNCYAKIGDAYRRADDFESAEKYYELANRSCTMGASAEAYWGLLHCHYKTRSEYELSLIDENELRADLNCQCALAFADQKTYDLYNRTLSKRLG